MRRLMLVHGDKGGTGKTHAATLIAAVLRQAGHPVALVDGDAKNPGLHRLFDGKPDAVACIDVRKPVGVDALMTAFLETDTDMLVDLPAGGSDLTAAFLGDGIAVGSVDIANLFPETGDCLVVFFVLDQGRDPIIALADEMERLPLAVTHWVIVRNHRIDRPFDRLEAWLSRTGVDATIIDMPAVDPSLVDALVSAKLHFGEADRHPELSALQKIRARNVLRVWRAQLAKSEVFDV